METENTYLENEIENILFCVSKAKIKIESAIDYTYLTGYESDIRILLGRALELLNGIDSSSEEIKDKLKELGLLLEDE